MAGVESEPPMGLEGARHPRSRKPLLDRFWFRALLRTATIVLILAAWHVYSGRVSPIIMPSPRAVLTASIDMARSGEIFAATATSMKAFAAGYFLAGVSGIMIGIAVGRVRGIAVATDHVFNALYVTPQIAFLPLIIVWFGLGFKAKVVVVFLVSVFPILFNTADGVGQISRNYVEVARSYGAGELQLIREVMIPSILPFIMTGLRLGAGRGLTGMIVAEFFTAISGLGGIIVRSSNTLQTAEMFVPIVALGIIGMLIIQGGRLLENRLVRWKQTERAF